MYLHVVLAYGIYVKQCFVFWKYQKFGLVKGGLHQTIKCTHFAFFFCRYGCTVSCILDQNVESHDYASIAWWRRWKKEKRLTVQKKRLLWFEPTFRMSFISVMVKLVLIYWLRRNYCEEVVHGINKVNIIYHWVTCVWNYLIYCKTNKTACQWVIVQKLRLYKNQNDEISTIFKTNKDIA